MAAEVRKKVDQLRRGIVPEGYKKTSFGIAPVEWTGTCLGDIYTERKEPGNETLPLLMVSIHSGVSDGEVDEDDLPKKVKRIEDKSQYKRAATGDLVFNMMRAWQGAIGTVRTEGMVSPAYIVAEPNKMVDPLFMDYYMKTDRMVHTIHRQSYGVTDFRLRLYWDSFAPIKCVLPSVAEQKKIAAILTTQDKVIELKEKRLAEKQRQKKHLMQQLLTGKKRLPGFGDTWDKYELSALGRFCSGSAFPEEYQGNADGEIPFYKVSDMNTHAYSDYLTTANNYISSDVGEMLRASVIPKGSIVFAKVGAALLLERKKVLQFPSCIDNNMMAFTCKSEIVDSLYMLYWFQLQKLSKHSNIGALPSLNAGHLGHLTMCLPSKFEQQAITNIMILAEQEILLMQQDIQQEQQKKKALMQLLLTGIVRVEA